MIFRLSFSLRQTSVCRNIEGYDLPLLSAPSFPSGSHGRLMNSTMKLLNAYKKP
jgi:hypothetical protein